MKSRLFGFVVCVMIFLCCVPAFAQRETGTILGTVTNEGQPLPGATVTVSGSSLIGGSNVTYSDKEGSYRFPALPPGTYEVKAELQGFQTVMRKGIRLFVGNAVTIDLDVQPQQVSESVDVSGETPMIDATTTAESKTVPIEQIENLPKFSFALDLFTLTPGVSDLDYVAYGAGGSGANAYWLDGVDVSNPASGNTWIFPNYNWLQEVQVVGLGAPAEYGGFTGVISNSITRSGSNQFHGLFETFFENDSLVSTNSEGLFTRPIGVDTFTDNTAQLGGPILKDKLWFFSGFQYYWLRDVPLGYSDFRTDREPRWLNKLTYKVNQNNTLQGFMEWDHYDITGRYGDAFDPPEATGIVKAPEWVYNAGWTSLFGPSTVLDVRANGFDSKYDILSVNGTGVSGHFDGETGIYTENLKGTYITHRNRLQVNASVSHYAQNFIHGDHDFKFGVEFERDGMRRKYYYNGGIYYYDSGGSPYYRYLWEGYDSNSRIHRTSSFAQDTWSFNKNIKLSVGLRWDHNRGSIVDQATVYKTDPVAPRLGVIYDLHGDQKTIIKGHYGRYYESTIASYFDALGDYADKITQYFYGGEWETTAVQTKSDLSINSKLKQPLADQYVIGVDQELPAGSALSVHYIRRREKNFIDDVNSTGQFVPVTTVNPLTGQTITVFNQLNPGDDHLLITNPEGLFRKYDGVEIVGSTRFTSKLNITGSLVISKVTGNINNTTSSNAGATLLFDDPNYNINFIGKLSTDPTYEVKVTAYYNLPWGILTSGYFRHATNYTWTPTFRTPSGLLDQGRRTIFALPRGSRRLPGRNVFDFRLEKAFPVYRGNLKATVDVFNLFNTGYPTDLETRVDLTTFGQFSDFTFPREVRIGARYQF